jgi:hypothetical protein
MKGFTQVVTGLGELGVTQEDILDILERLRPYLEPVAPYLHGAAIPQVVNSERAEIPFTVHDQESGLE